MSEYTEQAEQFLSRHNLTFRAVYMEHAPYFPDDTESRDIYRLTIAGNGRGRYSTKFGQSINGTIKGETPRAYDLLTCMTKYDPGTFDNFCGEFGYGTDSRKAERVYRSVVRDWKKVRAFFTDAELEELQEIN